jgi:hypothetical protein
MRDLNIFFHNSIEDLIFLLDRKYPKKQAIEIVGNRYRLNHSERMILYRGVFDTHSTVLRKEKRVEIQKIKRLAIDGYNVLITLESYLKGRIVFRSLDGFVRDVAGIYGKQTIDHYTQKCIALLVEFLQDCLMANSGFFQEGVLLLDLPVSKSGELASYLRDSFSLKKLNVKVDVVKNPDGVMIEEVKLSKDTVVATSDTVVLDNVGMSFDIPDYIIREMLYKKVVDLELINRSAK